jgi:hypothetical protein
MRRPRKPTLGTARILWLVVGAVSVLMVARSTVLVVFLAVYFIVWLLGHRVLARIHRQATGCAAGLGDSPRLHSPRDSRLKRSIKRTTSPVCSVVASSFCNCQNSCHEALSRFSAWSAGSEPLDEPPKRLCR